MERKYHRLQVLTAITGFLVLIFDSTLALEGARAGVELCIKLVIPSLFPFFVLSSVLTNALQENIPKPLELLNAVLSIPKAASSVIIPAVLGGYPVGAKSIGDLYQRNLLTKRDAERLLTFCSNAGPSFLFGMVSGFFPEAKVVWLLWLIQISSVLLTATVFPAGKTDISGREQESKTGSTSTILSSARAMGVVCCWVILFRMIITFSKDWFLWLLPSWAQVILMGFLELTNGCCELMMISDIGLRFVLCSCMLSFGGICVFLQTVSVINGLNSWCYLKGKLVQTAFSFMLSLAFVSGYGRLVGLLLPTLVVILKKMQNRYGNLRILPV